MGSPSVSLHHRAAVTEGRCTPGPWCAHWLLLPDLEGRGRVPQLCKEEAGASGQVAALCPVSRAQARTPSTHHDGGFSKVCNR